LPWTDPAHQSPLELLAGRIASQIAGRTVTVQCHGETDWTALIRGRGGDPDAESGFVATAWNGATGQLVSSSSVAELSGRDTCLLLDTFATATTKPTKCLVSTPTMVSLPVEKRVRVQQSGAAGAKPRGRKAKRGVQRLGPCYLGNGKTARPMTASFWSSYERYAVAILTLAHESIHLGGVVGGQLSNGLSVGDQQAEAKADCYGMQKMSYVAEQLGDTPDDAQAIAAYFWDRIYPRARTSSYAHYWSADCRPGGPLDIRPSGATAWP
jgi:hypothetical protein